MIHPDVAQHSQQLHIIRNLLGERTMGEGSSTLMRVLVRPTQLIALLLALLVAPSSHAIVIEYEALDLADTTLGENLWQYSYRVSDYDFLADQGFTVWFDAGLYDNLVPVSASLDWDALVVQPDLFLPDAGFYDALALADHASLADSFNLQFTWLGNGAPGSQAFDLYDVSNGSFVVTNSGNTVLRGVTSVPEPAPLWLMFAGGAAAWWVRRKGRRAPLF